MPGIITKSLQNSRGWSSLLAMLMVLISAGSGAAAEVIRNDTPQFTLIVPAGYEQIPATQGMEIYTFIRRGSDAGLPDAMVGVRRLRGTIGQEPAMLPPNAPAGAYETTAKWKGYDIDVLVSHVSQSGVTLACRTAQIPLDGEAIQLVVAVPPDREATADAILAQFLDGLDGPSNWPPPMTAAERQSQHTRRLATAIVAPIASPGCWHCLSSLACDVRAGAAQVHP